MQTKPHAPGVPLPPGANVVDDWHEFRYEYRLIATETREVEGTNVGIELSACQFPDQSFLDDGREFPKISVLTSCPGGWSSLGVEVAAEGARQLARALIAAADQLDGWGTDPA
jgi:hypothetical protein